MPWALLGLRSLLLASSEALQSGTDDALLYDTLLEKHRKISRLGKRKASDNEHGDNVSTKVQDSNVDDDFKSATARKSMMWPMAAGIASLASGWLVSLPPLPAMPSIEPNNALPVPIPVPVPVPHLVHDGAQNMPTEGIRQIVFLSLLPAIASLLCSASLYEAKPDTVGVSAQTQTACAAQKRRSESRCSIAGCVGWLRSQIIPHATRSLEVLTQSKELRLLTISNVVTVSFADGVHLLNPLILASKQLPVSACESQETSNNNNNNKNKSGSVVRWLVGCWMDVMHWYYNTSSYTQQYNSWKRWCGVHSDRVVEWTSTCGMGWGGMGHRGMMGCMKYDVCMYYVWSRCCHLCLIPALSGGCVGSRVHGHVWILNDWVFHCRQHLPLSW